MSTKTIEQQKLTPPQVAAMWGTTQETIHAFIRSGELKAINFARPGCNQRPRYKIDIRDLEDFERRRQVSPAPSKPPRRKRKEVGSELDYY